ncbi:MULTISPECIES: hypothetical protein [Nocardia]|uniref:hypothetical protein n=1 Tax=Nocardia TaxID=1817 RepID=UPI0018E4FC04|nr:MULTISPECIES: hypothetical protein [Nocardia]
MDPVEGISKDDWTDTDLLTRAEAGERLDQEIAVATRELEILRVASAPDAAAVELLTRRIDAMRKVRAHLADRPDRATRAAANSTGGYVIGPNGRQGGKP